MSQNKNQKTYKELIYIISMLFMASSIISYFKSYHYAIGIFFLALIIISLIRTYKKKNLEKSIFWLSLFGISFTAIMGLIVEIWGTSNGYWTYFDIPKHIHVPFWVPFAWGLAYKAIYRVEQTLLQYFDSPLQKWLFCVILPAMILPVLGEIFVIYFGTWNYSWQPQYLGMPLIAVILLCLFHVCIFLTMGKICQIYSIKDPVYSALIKIK